MDSELNKIDILRSRYRIGYAEARDALNDASGDVVEALAALDNDYPHADRPDLLMLCAEAADDVQRLVSSGPIKRLRVKYANRVISEKPVALTAAATLAVGLAAVLISKLAIEVDRDEEGTAR